MSIPSLVQSLVVGGILKEFRSKGWSFIPIPSRSDFFLYCPPRKLQTTPLRLSNLIDLTFLLGMEGLLTDSETQSSDLDSHTGVKSTLSSCCLKASFMYS